jgi:ribosome-associated protein
MKEGPVIPEQGKQTRKTREAVAETDAPVGETAAGETGRLDERMVRALGAAGEKKALDLVALDLRELASFTDFFLIASGNNSRQVQAIADSVEETLKKHGTRPARIEGYTTAEWVLLDYGDFIFHVFDEKARRFYDLERLWRDAVRVALPLDLTSPGSGSSGSSLRTES